MNLSVSLYNVNAALLVTLTCKDRKSAEYISTKIFSTACMSFVAIPSFR